MIIFAIIKLAFRNVVTARKKSLSAMLSVAAGFLALNLFQAYIVDTNVLFDQTYESRSMLGDLLIRKANRSDLTSIDEQNEINKFIITHREQIAAAVPFLDITGMLNTGSVQTVFAGYGYDLEQGRRIRGESWKWNVLAGKPLDQTAEAERTILVGRRLGEIAGCNESEFFKVMITKNGFPAKERPFVCVTSSFQLSLTTQTGQVNASDFKVGGITDGLFRDIDERLVVMSLTAAQSLLHTDQISMMALKLSASGSALALKKDFIDSVQKKFPQLLLKSWKDYELGDFYNKSINFLFVFRDFVTLVVISIGALSVLTTFYRLVFERTREIGTLLSVGFRPRHIFTLILSEALFLSLMGVIIGIISSYVVASAINFLQVPYKLGMLSEAVPFAMTINLEMLLLSAGTLILISIGICTFPVKRALRMKVSDALRDSA